MGGMTALQMRANMRTDLKDSGSLWSDAELSRCIDRAVADLSRYLPYERYYELTLDLKVEDESITFPADTDADRIVDGADISATADGATLTLTAQPDVPRPLTMTVTDANGSITNMSVIVKGTDRFGKALQEVFQYAAGMGVITGKKYFKTVNEVEVDQIDGNGASDVLDIGIGAYTDVWVYLANKPIKSGSDTGTDDASASLTRDTDYEIDLAQGGLKALSGGDISAGEVCTFSYTKIQVGIDLSPVPDLIRVQRCEYPVGKVPQQFVPTDIHGSTLFITGTGEDESQPNIREGDHVRVYYDAEHIPPNTWGPGTIPEFLENTVIMAAEAYALLIYSLKHQHQGETDLGSMRTSLGSANSAHTALGTALTNIKKYLDNNSNADAAGILQDITDDIANLRTAIATALNAANAYLDSVATDISNADGVRASYLTTTNYVDGGTAPDIKKYLDDGDALLNTLAQGGEQQEVPRAYLAYAQAVKDALVAAHEQDRSFYLEDARARTNAGLGFVQEASQRVQNILTYIQQAEGYSTVAATFAREAEARLNEIAAYLQQASGYGESASGEMVLADRYRTEAVERRNEVYSIWTDRKQYIGDFTMGSVRQMPKYQD